MFGSRKYKATKRKTYCNPKRSSYFRYKGKSVKKNSAY